ncbi:MAG: hypothetical protein F6K48_18155 [Okeania sp. SIO3H1]|nr:hypothetical protein [Okeania sp. SIO3H1]
MLFVGDRRQPTPRPSPSQEGKTGEMGRERGGRSKNCLSIFLPSSSQNTWTFELFPFQSWYFFQV